MKVPIKIHYFMNDQRLEFTCPFCNQVQAWKGSVQVANDKVYPDPGVAFRLHMLGDSDGAGACLVKPSIYEVEAYTPVATIEP